MSQKQLYVDTRAVERGARALGAAADAFGGFVGSFQAGAARPEAAGAFGDLGPMTEAGRHYLEMTTATVTTLRQVHEVINQDASRLTATGLAYERADDAVAASSGVGGRPGGPRIIAVDFGELRDARDSVARQARALAHEIASLVEQGTHLSTHWKGPAAGAFQERLAQCRRRASNALARLVAYHAFLDHALRVYEATEQYEVKNWPTITGVASSSTRPDGREAVSVAGWEGIATDVARAVLFMFGLPWPGGVPGELRALAACWRTAAGAADELLEELKASASAVGGAWQGRAAVAFDEHIRAQQAHLAQAPGGLRAVAFALEQYAAEVEQIVGTIVQIATEIAVMIVAGRLLGFVTGFVSDLVADAAVAARVARITACLARLTESAGRLSRLLGSTVHTIELLRAVLATLAEEARIELSLSKVGAAARSLDSVATRIGGAEYRTIAAEMAREWGTDFTATAAQQLITTGHVDPELAVLNATTTAAGRGAQLRWEGSTALLRNWRQSRPLLYAATSGAVMNELNGALVDLLSGKDAEETALDLAVRPVYSAPRGVFSNHPTAGPRRSGIPIVQKTVESTSLKTADKVARTLTERQIEATQGYDAEPESAVDPLPG